MKAEICNLDGTHPDVLLRPESDQEAFILRTIMRQADGTRLHVKGYTLCMGRLQSALIGAEQPPAPTPAPVSP